MNTLPDMKTVSITPSLMLEYLYCARFVFYMEAMHLPQNEAARFKVKEGRIIHRKRSLENREYKRIKLGVKEKLISEPLYAEKHSIHGIVDEILVLDDGTAAPLDYKFAEYKGKVFKTYKTQLVMYGLMIKESMSLDVKRGYIVYTRSKNHIEEVNIDTKDLDSIEKKITAILKIINMGFFPKATRDKAKCMDCCYRNVCIK